MYRLSRFASSQIKWGSKISSPVSNTLDRRLQDTNPYSLSAHGGLEDVSQAGEVGVGSINHSIHTFSLGIANLRCGYLRSLLHVVITCWTVLLNDPSFENRRQDKGFWPPWHVDVSQGRKVCHGRRGQISNCRVMSCCQEACCILCDLCVFRIWLRGKWRQMLPVSCWNSYRNTTSLKTAFEQSSAERRRRFTQCQSLKYQWTDGTGSLCNMLTQHCQQNITWHILTYVDFYRI